MIHDAGQVGIGERNTPERRGPQNFAGGRLSVGTKEKTGLRIEISVTPAIQDDSRNVPRASNPV